ncbi:MAG TPA: acetolactate synthase small subunit [Candidatus Omnitrophota bacterium]|nr:acetolactate synthase small subunit [Candidatus Omnitrophota bacterium]
MKRILSVLVENHFGVLARVSGLFSARGFNIDSLTVGETEDPTVSRMTIVTHGDDPVLEQIMKQLNKLVDVIKVVDLTNEDTIDRELVLAKINATATTRPDIIQVVNTFRAKVVDVGSNSLTVEVTGTESKLDAMMELLKPFGIRELVRTGLISVARKREITVKGKEGKTEKQKKASAKKKAEEDMSEE